MALTNGTANAKVDAKANGTANGATESHASQKVLDDTAGLIKTTDGHEKTDYTRWRLKDDRGCQTWHYLQTDEELKAWPQSTADKYFLGLDTVCLPTSTQPRRPFD